MSLLVPVLDVLIPARFMAPYDVTILFLAGTENEGTGGFLGSLNCCYSCCSFNDFRLTLPVVVYEGLPPCGLAPLLLFGEDTIEPANFDDCV